jgi:nucleotide-binding universal stress UspA family protein
MAKQTEINPKGRAKDEADAATPFRRMLVAIDESPAAVAAVGLVAAWVDGPGAEVRFIQVTETRSERGNGVESESGAGQTPGEPAHRLVVGAPTLGARNRQLVHGIAEAAEGFGPDVIVLGFDRRRLAGHRLAPSLREQIMRATDLPVLVAPSPQSGDTRHHGLAPDLDHAEERAEAAPGYVRV